MVCPLIFTPNYLSFAAAFFFATFLIGAFAVFRAAVTAETSGRRPKALSFGLRALRATGAIAATNAVHRSAGSVTPDIYKAIAAPRTERPYDANIALCSLVKFIFPPRIELLLSYHISWCRIVYMPYDRFFNIHIPKTGGTYFRENLLKSIEADLIHKGVRLNPSGDGGISSSPSSPTFHWCWFEPYVQDNSFIFTSLRDPAKRIVSHYAWQAVRVMAHGSNTSIKHDINKNNFFNWLETNSAIYKNFQSKNLVYYNSDHSIYKEASIGGWDNNGSPIIKSFLFEQDFIDFPLSMDQLHKNINRINIIVKADDLSNIDYQYKVLDAISEAFEIPKQTNKGFYKYGNQNEHSKTLFDQLTQKEIDSLYDHSEIDSEIYFSNIYTKV